MHDEPISGQRIQLRPATQDDARLIYDALAHSALVTPQGHPVDPPAQAAVTQHVKEVFLNDFKPHYFDDAEPLLGRCFIIMANGKPVGQIKHNTIDQQAKRTELDLWLFSMEQCGHGYGPDALQTLCGHISRRLGVNEFYTKPEIDNQRAVRASEKAGFNMTFLSMEESEEIYGPRKSDKTIYMIKRV